VCVKQVWGHDEVGEAVQYRLFQGDSNFRELMGGGREGRGADSDREEKKGSLGSVCMYFPVV